MSRPAGGLGFGRKRWPLAVSASASGRVVNGSAICPHDGAEWLEMFVQHASPAHEIVDVAAVYRVRCANGAQIDRVLRPFQVVIICETYEVVV